MAFKTTKITEEKTSNPNNISIVIGYVRQSHNGQLTAFIFKNDRKTIVDIHPAKVKPGLYAIITNVSENETSDDTVPAIMEIDGHYVYLNVECDDEEKWKYIGEPVKIIQMKHTKYDTMPKVKKLYVTMKPTYKSFGDITDNAKKLMSKTESIKKTNQILKKCDNNCVYYCPNGAIKIYETEWESGECEYTDISYVLILSCKKYKLMCQ